jgi:hypothetical protein
VSYYFSGSSHGKARLCPGSTALPKGAFENPKADPGSALHEHLADRVNLGTQGAFSRIQEVALNWELDEGETRIFEARCRTFNYHPPRGALAEVPLALLSDGRVVRVEGARSVYQAPPETILPITIDLIFAEPEPLVCNEDGSVKCPEGSVLWTPDYKTGRDEYVDPVEYNRQALDSALIAGKFTGARLVMPAICLVRRGEGEWDVRRDAQGNAKPYTMDELAWLEQEIRETHEACVEQESRYAAGEPLRLVEGLHCGWCGARDSCPAKLAMIRSVVTGELQAPSRSAGPLTVEHAAQLAQIKPQLQRWLAKADDVLKTFADEHGAIPVGEGRVYGPHEVEEDEIHVEAAIPIVAAEIGPKFAQKAVRPASMSKTALNDAIRDSLEASGVKRQGAATQRRVYAKMLASGALGKVKKVKYEVYKLAPKPAEAVPEVTGTEETFRLLPPEPRK